MQPTPLHLQAPLAWLMDAFTRLEQPPDPRVFTADLRAACWPWTGEAFRNLLAAAQRRGLLTRTERDYEPAVVRGRRRIARGERPACTRRRLTAKQRIGCHRAPRPHVCPRA